MKNDVFISYRRDGGEYTAKILRDQLTELGYRVFLDVETLRSGDFNTQLYDKIEECRDFLLILSPNALDRCVNEGDWVRSEVEHALACNKNIVPILLRGFRFPETLPPSIAPLTMKNGLEASTEFFDAFVQKLQTFLLTKPGLFRRLRQNMTIRKAVPLLLALAVLAGAVLGGTAIYRSVSAGYPYSAQEKNLTQEALYYTGLNLTYYNILADAKLDAIAAAERFLSTGGTDVSELENAIAVSLQTVEKADVSSAAPSELFLTQLSESPFPYADFVALHDNLVSFRQVCADDIAYIQLLASPDYYLSDSYKLQALACYRRSLEQELQAYAYAANQQLLPITEQDAMHDFLAVTLTQLEHIPLRAANWLTDSAALEQAMDECFNNMESCLLELSSILGSSTQSAAEEEAALVQAYVDAGYTQQDAEAIADLIKQGYEGVQAEYMLVLTKAGYTQEQALAIYDYAELQHYTLTTARALVEHETADLQAAREAFVEYYLSQGADAETAEKLADSELELEQSLYQARLLFCAKTDDDVDTLWAKFVSLKDCMLYDEANECLDLFLLAMDGDPYAETYVASVRLFLQQIPDTGTDYGVLVVGLTEEGHEVLQVGDIIIAFNGQPCRTAEQYTASKAALTEPAYTVTVLRPTDGALTRQDLNLTTEMPLIAISTLA